MIGSIVDQNTFEELLAKTLPRLTAHLKSVDVQIGMITQGWFICLFIGYLPLEISLQILDWFFFLQGRMLYAVGLAVFKTYESELMGMQEGDEIVVMLRDLHFCPDLLKTAIKYLESLDTGSIQELQNKGKFRVIKAMEKQTKHSALQMVAGRAKFEMPELHQVFTVFEDVASPDTFTVGEAEFGAILLALIPWIEWRQDLVPAMFKRACDFETEVPEADFERTVILLSEASKGSLKEKLCFYFQLHDLNDTGSLDKGDYYRTLDAVVRSYYNEGVYEADLFALVNWTFSEGDKENDEKITLEEICTLILPSAIPGAQTSIQEEADAQLGLLRHFLSQ